MGKDFFSKINYSASNEDSESERQVLGLNDKDIVLCITGSGARPLDLLIDLPQQIVSIDLNESQNFLLELKMAAFKCLEYKEFCGFIGLKPSEQRMLTYKKLESFISNPASRYWSTHQNLIEDGLLYCGTWERFLRGMLKMARPRIKIIRQLFASENIEEQRTIWMDKWDKPIWKLYLKTISNRFLWTQIIREPGAKIIPKEFDVYAYLKERLDFMAMNFMLKTNHYANLVFCGGYQEECILPFHLRKKNFDLIKQNLDRIEIVTDSLSSYLKPLENKFTAFSLSDFSSYAPPEIYQTIWQEIIEAAKPGARFCERQFLVKRNPEKDFSEINRNGLLEDELGKSDGSFIYSFCVGKIVKTS